MYHRKQKTQQENFRSIQIFFHWFHRPLLNQFIDPDQDQELDQDPDPDLDQDKALDQDQDKALDQDLDIDQSLDLGTAVFRIRFIDDHSAKTKN
jgi:hypothetical protein